MRGQSKNRNTGFTLIEMLVVILIIGILAAYFGQNIFGQTDDAKFTTAKIEVTNKIPAALIAYATTHPRPPANTDLTAALVKRGIPPMTPWGKPWSAIVHDDYVAINYPMKTPAMAHRLDTGGPSSDESTYGPMTIDVYSRGGLQFRYRYPN